MKRMVIEVVVFLCMLFSSALANDTVYALKNAKLYDVGKNINPGYYVLEFDKKETLKLAVVTVGNDLQYTSGRDAILIKNGEFTEYKIDSNNPRVELNLVEGNKLFVNAGSPRLSPVENKGSELSTFESNTAVSTQKKLSSEEVRTIIGKAPYVSNKSIIIDSPDGVDFYTYFGSGIIMSGSSGDCFEIVDCDDEDIVDHYKLMPLKVGKGKIEYVVNMKEKIVVNVTVKDSAFEKREPSTDDTSFARAVKSVNIRSKASSSSDRIGSLQKGERVKVITAFYTDDWHEIEYKDRICYISAKYVELE